MSIKVALVLPQITVENNYGNIWRTPSSKPIAPPLGLLYLSSSLERSGHKTKVFDSNIKKYKRNELNVIKDIKHFDPEIIGVSFNTTYFDSAELIIRMLKEHFPNALMAVGGPHATSLAADTLNTTAADYSISGEGEEVFVSFVNEFESGRDPGNLEGVLSKEDLRKEEAVKPCIIEDLDSLPFPDYGKVNLRDYRNKFITTINSTTCPIITARGCSASCEFCDPGTSGNRNRSHSAGYVVEMIENIIKSQGVSEFVFFDSSFGSFPERDRELCEEIIKRKLKIKYNCNMRAENADKEMLELMGKSGCWQILFGLESVNDNVRSRIPKKLDDDIVLNAVKEAKKNGIVVRGDFIFGLPGDTYNSISSTIDYALKLDLDLFINSYFAPYPGTRFFKQNNLYDVYKNSWGELNCFKVSYVPENMTADELEELSEISYRKFYLRKKIIIKHIKIAIKNFYSARKYFLIFISFTNFLLKRIIKNNFSNKL